MLPHHERALEKAKIRLLQQYPDLIAIIVGGSIAKKIERPESDVDLIVVVSDSEFDKALRSCKIGFSWQDICDYAGGYVEGRIVSKSFILCAARRGSDPTRSSFTGAFPMYCIDREVTDALAAIPVFSDNDKDVKIQAFLAQFLVNRGFFWNEGKRREDKYLQMRAITDIVLFGCRLILLENNQLFACQKKLVEQTLKCEKLPANFKEKLERLLHEMSHEAIEDFSKAVIEFREWPDGDRLSRFLKDVEISWFTGTHAVSEW